MLKKRQFFVKQSTNEDASHEYKPETLKLSGQIVTFLMVDGNKRNIAIEVSGAIDLLRNQNHPGWRN
jgi:hypothetical protein